jgi:HK97 family phage major capsid protein
MNKREFIKRALDTSNAFLSSGAEATAVNPNIWDYRLREFEEANLIVAPLAEQFDFRGAGVDYTVTIDEAPSAAGALVETTDITISSFTTRNLTFTPTEYGCGYQLTRKEAVRAFFNVADRMVRKLGYSLALKKDTLAVTELYTATTNAVLVNGKSATTDLASTDTLNYAAITAAIKNIEEDLYKPKLLIINHTQKQQLLNISTINKANEFGTRDAIQKGMVGELFGLAVYVTTQIPTASNVAKAVVLGTSGSGEAAFGYAIKRDPIIEKQYFARGRYWDIVAHEEYDFAVLHEKAIATIASYA